jgi:hypothetical protein
MKNAIRRTGNHMSMVVTFSLVRQEIAADIWDVQTSPRAVDRQAAHQSRLCTIGPAGRNLHTTEVAPVEALLGVTRLIGRRRPVSRKYRERTALFDSICQLALS